MRRAGTIKRALPIALLSALAAGPPALAATHETGGTSGGRPQARGVHHALAAGAKRWDARLISCRRSPSTDARTAVVGASMRPVSGSKRFALRVDLYQRPIGGGRWALRTDVPGLGTWSTPSDPTIGSRPNDVYKYRQAVGRLIVPYQFRFRVSFRWFDAAGTLVREQSATTAPCREPDLRPDLFVVRARLAPDQPGLAEGSAARWQVTVRNAGRSPAFDVRVVAQTTTAQPGAGRTVKRLQPQETTDVRLLGPACADDGSVQSVTFVVDPDGAVDESDENDNVLAIPCPATLQAP